MAQKKFLISIICIGLVVFVSAVFVFGRKQSPVKPSSSLTPTAVASAGVKKWADRIAIVGAEQAYQEFKDANHKESLQVQHAMAHVFGEALYEQKGLDGISVCDSEFAFGCYHSFLTRAIAEHGVAVLTYLDQKCLDKYGPLGTGCQHGIGHGVMEYTGPTKIEEALTLCGKTTQLNPLFGCTSGVFMEYNSPLVLGEGSATVQPRPFDPAAPYGTCPMLSRPEFRWSCYYEIPAWWYGGQSPKEIGKLCHALTSPEERQSCLQGMGQAIVESTSYQASESIAGCQTAASQADKVLCLSGAAWTFYANPEFRSADVALCDAVSGQDRNVCRKKANLICNGITDNAARLQCEAGNTVF